MTVSSSTWEKIINRHGVTVSLIRLGSPADTTVSVKMMRQYASEDPLVHEVSQQQARFVVEHAKLVAAGFPFPPAKNDRIVSLGKYYTVSLVEPKSAYGELVGYKITCAGIA